MSERKFGCERAYGPYKHHDKWRVVVVGADGKPIGRNPDGSGGPRSFESEKEAVAFRDQFNAAIEARSLEDAVLAYLDAHKSAKRGPNETNRYRLYGILRLAESNGLLISVTPKTAGQLYAQRCGEVKPATHHGELALVGRFFSWCVDKGWVKRNPFDGVLPQGVAGRGKPKLRIDPSRKLVEYLLADNSVEATAVLTALLLGMRATEVVERTVGELDNGGRLLWIAGNVKTIHSEREIEVPETLRVRLMALAHGKQSTDRLFGDVDRHWLHYHTVRLCKLAGVPRVTPHGLRGTALTNVVRLGGSVELAADLAGHGDNGATLRRHYLAGGAEESARGRALEQLLTGKPNENGFPRPTKELLS